MHPSPLEWTRIPLSNSSLNLTTSLLTYSRRSTCPRWTPWTKTWWWCLSLLAPLPTIGLRWITDTAKKTSRPHYSLSKSTRTLKSHNTCRWSRWNSCNSPLRTTPWWCSKWWEAWVVVTPWAVWEVVKVECQTWTHNKWNKWWITQWFNKYCKIQQLCNKLLRAIQCLGKCLNKTHK